MSRPPYDDDNFAHIEEDGGIVLTGPERYRAALLIANGARREHIARLEAEQRAAKNKTAA